MASNLKDMMGYSGRKDFAEDQKNKFIEAYVQGGGQNLGGFKYDTGEYLEGKVGGFMNSPF